MVSGLFFDEEKKSLLNNRLIENFLLEYNDFWLTDTNLKNLEDLLSRILKEIEHMNLNLKTTYFQYLVTIMFKKRDIRGIYGNGNRNTFYRTYLILYRNYPEIMIQLIPQIYEFGSWLDIKNLYEIVYDELKGIEKNKLLDALLFEFMTTLKVDEFLYDMGTQKNEIDFSLVTKWIPKEGSSLDKKSKIYTKLAKIYYPECNQAKKKLRMIISKINKRIDTTEIKMCAQKYSQINFYQVPKKCLLKRKKAWINIDKNGIPKINSIDRNKTITNYLLFIQQSKINPWVKINDRETTLNYWWNIQTNQTTSLAEYPDMTIKEYSLYDIVYYIINYKGGSNKLKMDNKILYDILEKEFDKHFKNIRDYYNKIKNSVIVFDTSNSMYKNGIEKYIYETIIISYLNQNIFHNRILTFENNPRWLILEYPKSVPEYYSYPGQNSSKFPIGEYWNYKRVGKELDWLEKIDLLKNAAWNMSTNFLQILNKISIYVQVEKKQMPHDIFCITDKSWFQANNDNRIEILKLNNIKNIPNVLTYESGIDILEYFFNSTTLPFSKQILSMPNFTLLNIQSLWNMNKLSNTFDDWDSPCTPIIRKHPKIISLYGRHTLFNYLLNLNTKWEMLKKIILSENYNNIRKILKEDNFLEKSLSYFTKKNWDKFLESLKLQNKQSI